MRKTQEKVYVKIPKKEKNTSKTKENNVRKKNQVLKLRKIWQGGRKEVRLVRRNFLRKKAIFKCEICREKEKNEKRQSPQKAKDVLKYERDRVPRCKMRKKWEKGRDRTEKT